MTSVERAFPALLQEFFHGRLIAQRGASAHTIASYRDTFTLFLGYAAERTGRTPSALTLSDLGAPMVLGFLDHIETERGNSARTRNLRAHRHPVVHALRLATRAVPAARHATRPRDSRQALRPARPRLPVPRRDHGDHRRARPVHLERTARRRPLRRPLQHRRLRLGDDQAARRRRASRPGVLAASARQGTQGAYRPALEEHRRATAEVAPPNRWNPRRSCVSQPRGQALVALRGRTSTARRLPKGCRASPIARDAADLAPHAAPHDRDAPAPVRSRYHRHRPLASATRAPRPPTSTSKPTSP